MAALDANWCITADRYDQGRATLVLWEKLSNGTWMNRAQTQGAWDDAIPWSTGTYDGAWRPTPKHPVAWDINIENSSREAIRLHAGTSSLNSYGCLVADTAFLNTVKTLVKTADLDFQVRGFNPTIGLTLTSSATTVEEGQSCRLNVNLTGDSTGVSKDCYVLVRQTGGNATKLDYAFDKSGLKQFAGQKNDADPNKKAIPTEFFVKIPAGQTQASILVNATSDKLKEKTETATFEIVDYYFNSPGTAGGTRLYSDYKGVPKVLIKNSADRKETISITEAGDTGNVGNLGNLNVLKNGGIEGFSGRYAAAMGVTYTWNFNAQIVPDTLKIFDNTGLYVNLVNVIFDRSGSFQLRPNSNGVVTVEVIGSSSQTAWSLNVSGAAARVMTFSAADAGAGIAMSESSSASKVSILPETGKTVLEDTLADRAFALAEDDSGIANAAFKALAGKVAGAASADYDYVYHRTKVAGGANIEVGDSLAGSNGIVSAGNGADKVDMSKSSSSNLIVLGNGNDVAKGGSGNDIVRGENGNDTIAAGGGNDRIDGGNGQDTIEGGSDHGRFSHAAAATAGTALTFVAGDVLAGGKGPDTFVYKAGDGVDHITDFRIGHDKLVLTGIESGDLRSTTKDGDLYLGFDDGAGGWIEDAVIRIENVTDLHALQNNGGLLFA